MKMERKWCDEEERSGAGVRWRGSAEAFRGDDCDVGGGGGERCMGHPRQEGKQ